MTLEEFKKKGEEDDEYAPGWDAIDSALSKVYPDMKCDHYGTNMVARAMFGGDEWLDGYSIFTSPKGYKHIITYGMTELYFDEECFGGEFNNWGYEMTIKLAETDNENCMWAISMLGNLARYTYTEKSYFEPFQYIKGNGKSICLDRDSKITALITVNDTELESMDTVYGRTDFIQLVGITEDELNAILVDLNMIKVIVDKMKVDNPDLITDLNRTKSYV